MGPWLTLLIAAAFEIAWAVGLKATHGFTRFWPSVFTLLAMVASLVLLAMAIRTIPLGTGYAIWTGIGAVGTAAFGIAFFGEPATWPRLGCIALIVIGLVGLKLVTPDQQADRVVHQAAPLDGPR